MFSLEILNKKMSELESCQTIKCKKQHIIFFMYKFTGLAHFLHKKRLQLNIKTITL